MKEPKKHHAVYIPMDLYEKILATAKEDDRSFNKVIVRLVKEALTNREARQ